MTSDTEIKRRLEALQDKTKGRACHTMADIIDGKIEPNVLTQWASHPLSQLYIRGHKALGDPTAGLIYLSSLVLDAIRPAATGRQLVNLHETTQEIVKIRLRNRGKATKTDRGNGSIYSYAGPSDFIEIRPNKELGMEDGWTRNDLEDAEWGIEAEAVMSLRADLMERETDVIIAKLNSVTSEQLGGHVAIEPDKNFVADTLIDMWTAANEADQEPDTCVISKPMLGRLLKDKEFKDSTLLGSFVNYNTGMVGQFLGMQLIVSSLHPATAAYCFNKQRALQYVLRRDSLLTPFEQPPNDWMLNISMRYGLEFGDTKSIVACRK